MSRKCQNHKYNECEFVYLKPINDKNVLICPRCVDDSNGKIKLIDCVAIKKIFEANSQTLLYQYPPLTDSELNQMMLHFSGSIDEEIKQIKEYYQNLIQSYQTEVQKAMERSKAEIDQLQRLRESFIKQYKDIVQIEKLKQLVVQSQKDSNSDTQLLSFIETKQKEATMNTNKLLAQVKELQQFKESFSTKQPEILKSSILQEIQQISFFNKTIMVNQSSQSFILPQKNIIRRSIINDITIKPSSDIGDSLENLKIDRKMNKQIQIKNNGYEEQCFFESALNPMKKYIISILAIIENKEDIKPYFYFGIIPFSLRNSEQVDDKGICYLETYDCYGISKMVKGNKLHLGGDFDSNMKNYWRLNRQRRFEVRINLENRILKVGSLPDYDLVAEIDDDMVIDLAQEYTFAILSFGRGNVIILEDVCEVDSFDDLM